MLGTFLAWGGLKLLVAALPQNLIPAESVIEWLTNGLRLFFETRVIGHGVGTGQTSRHQRTNHL